MFNLLVRLVLQTFHQLHCPSLDMLQHPNVLLVAKGAKLNTGFDVWPHQGPVQRHNHCSSPAGHNFPDTGQGDIGKTTGKGSTYLLYSLQFLLELDKVATLQHTEYALSEVFTTFRAATE